MSLTMAPSSGRRWTSHLRRSADLGGALKRRRCSRCFSEPKGKHRRADRRYRLASAHHASGAERVAEEGACARQGQVRGRHLLPHRRCRMVDVEAEIVAFDALTSAQLRDCWARIAASAVPKVSPSLLRLALAWELQAEVHGGLPREVTRVLDQQHNRRRHAVTAVAGGPPEYFFAIWLRRSPISAELTNCAGGDLRLVPRSVCCAVSQALYKDASRGALKVYLRNPEQMSAIGRLPNGSFPEEFRAPAGVRKSGRPKPAGRRRCTMGN